MKRKTGMDYLEGVEHGVLFSIILGPDYNGRLRKNDVATCIRSEIGTAIPSRPQPPKGPRFLRVNFQAAVFMT